MILQRIYPIGIHAIEINFLHSVHSWSGKLKIVCVLLSQLFLAIIASLKKRCTTILQHSVKWVRYFNFLCLIFKWVHFSISHSIIWVVDIVWHTMENKKMFFSSRITANILINRMEAIFLALTKNDKLKVLETFIEYLVDFKTRNISHFSDEPDVISNSIC